MILDEERGFVLLSVPKTATKSVHWALGGGQHPEPPIYHMRMRDLLPLNPRVPELFKFSFVRNPWARLVSLYHDFTLKRGNQYSAEITFYQPLFSEFSSFHDFCLRVWTSPRWHYNLFLRPQYEFFTDDGTVDGKYMMDFVGKFENLHADFNIACDMANISRLDPGHDNKGVYGGDYKSYYSDDTKRVVGEVYAKDIQEFGYEF